jgi:hypothetical protein
MTISTKELQELIEPIIKKYILEREDSIGDVSVELENREFGGCCCGHGGADKTCLNITVQDKPIPPQKRARGFRDIDIRQVY